MSESDITHDRMEIDDLPEPDFEGTIEPNALETDGGTIGICTPISNLGLMPTCPTCGESSDTERGVRIHHTKSHGEPHPDTISTCPECDETFTAPPSAEKTFCSPECAKTGRTYLTGDDHPRATEHVTLTCEHCGEDYTRQPSAAEGSRFCTRVCQSAWQSENFSGDGWYLAGVTGPDHPKYTGNEDYYGENWNEKRRERLEHDDYTCQACGMDHETHLAEFGTEHHVHHIRPIGSFEAPEAANTIDNLVTMCRRCHVTWEGMPVRPEVIRDDE